MLQINLHDLAAAKPEELTRVICVSRYNGKWVFCKHKQRDTWEIPGGHIEAGEDYETAAKRELFEETGATDVTVEPVCLYSISSFGMLCFAEIKQLRDLPESEIEKIAFFDDLPQNLTYPDSHKMLFEKVKEYKNI